MSFHQISDGSRVRPTTSSDMQCRLIEILTDRSRLERNSRLASPARILLRHATARQDVPLPAWLPRGPMGECYNNALLALLASAGRAEEPVYVEGYAYSSDTDIIYEHAWVENLDGQVFEVTWPPGETRSYMGMAFTRQQVSEALLARRLLCSSATGSAGTCCCGHTSSAVRPSRPASDGMCP
jgi:hypothetical protein